MPTTSSGIYYESTGSGSPLVLLHGVTLNGQMWDEVVSRLAEQFRCVAVDRRGHGRSARLADGASIAADLLGVLDDAGLDRGDFVGFSLGGTDAIQFAGLHQERVRRLMVLGAWLPAPQTASWQPWRAMRGATVEAAREAWLGDDIFASTRQDPKVTARMREMVEANDLAIWFRRFRPTSEPAAVDLVPAITVPTQVVVGELELPEFRDLADWLQRTIPGAATFPVVTLPGVGHMAAMERPELVVETIRAFLA